MTFWFVWRGWGERGGKYCGGAGGEEEGGVFEPGLGGGEIGHSLFFFLV